MEDKTQSIEDPIDIESDWLLVHDKEKYAHFKGNVRVVRGETKLRSEELKVDYAGGDNLAAATEANAGTPAQIKKIVARGSVHALLTQRGAKDTKMANRPGESAPGAATESAPGAASGKQSDEASTGTKVAGAGPQSETVPAPSAASKKREISRLEAKGDVVIVSEKDETSTSDWAIYNLPSQLVTIGGNVVLSQGQSVLKGDRLVIDLKTGESRFENTGTAASGGRRIRALFMPKDDAKPGAKPNTPVGGRGNGSAGDQRTPDEPVIDNGEPMPIVPEYR
ncbi:MAG TPA: LptA/OstA family protein [Methyloceanibacter sp.]|nr:LptA/OstA family protein [Methyloceanibacter sp.]